MSLHPRHLNEIPAETTRVARAAFPKGTVYMQMRDELGTLSTDEAFAPCFRGGANRPRRRGGWH